MPFPRLHRILVAEGLLKKGGSGYRDWTGNEVPQKQIDAIKKGDVKGLARLLDAESGDDAYLFLEEMGGVLSDLLGKKSRRFRVDVDYELGQMRSQRAEAEVESFDRADVLKELTSYFQYTITPSNLKYIQYTPRRRGGKVTHLIMEDLDGQLGNVILTLKERDLRRGVTMDDVLKVLEDGGARLLKKRKRTRPRMFSPYD